jgi:aerotaxis receptor
MFRVTRDLPPVIDEPVEGFDIAELILSRTDTRGVIQSGNTTFQRLSGYEWRELINAPHKVIRHPDMPKAAFRLVWDMLGAGKSCGAYVKNRAKCGRHYWVFAALVPVDGGYLSVRLKPQTEHFETIKKLYQTILAAERQGAAIEDGVAMIEDAVQSLGFRNYTAFMGFALGAELKARCRSLGREVDPSAEQFEDMGNYLVEIADVVAHINQQFESMKNSPKNLIILGSRLSKGRESMQVVAKNYETLSAELMVMLQGLAEGLNTLMTRAFVGRMGHCASLLYEEAIRTYASDEPNRDTRGHAEELTVLQAALTGFQQEAEQGCRQIAREVDRFLTLNIRLKNMLSGLALTRVICRIETASLTENTDSIDEITTRLEVFQEELGRSLDQVAAACDALKKSVPSQAEITARAS